MAAGRLFAQAVDAFLHGKRAERLSRPQLVALALTPCRGAALAEEPPQVFATGLVGGHDGEHRFPCLHADDYRGPRSRAPGATPPRCSFPCNWAPRARSAVCTSALLLSPGTRRVDAVLPAQEYGGLPRSLGEQASGPAASMSVGEDRHGTVCLRFPQVGGAEFRGYWHRWPAHEWVAWRNGQP